MAGDGDTMVITGGNGFVGQHIIKLLHQHCQKEVKEIRVFDIKPYTQNLGKLFCFTYAWFNSIYAFAAKDHNPALSNWFLPC